MNNWKQSDIDKLSKAIISKKETVDKIGANALTKQVIKILWMKGWQVWRQNNAAVYDPTKNIFRSNSTIKGISDIIGFNKKDARFIAIEIKVGRDKLSIEQKLFLDYVNKAGGIGLEVRKIEDIDCIK
jgi:Holliday junction resolvase